MIMIVFFPLLPPGDAVFPSAFCLSPRLAASSSVPTSLILPPSLLLSADRSTPARQTLGFPNDLIISSLHDGSFMFSYIIIIINIINTINITINLTIVAAAAAKK